MDDAFSTAESIRMDWYGHLPFLNEGKGSGLGWEGVKEDAETKGCRRVSWQDWKKIDAAEKAVGQKKGKEREKFTKVEDMLAVLD
jgi:adrenodoxin-NADP+ reductase